MMHLTISGILISMKYGKNKAKGGVFISGSDQKVKNQEFDRKIEEML